MPLSSGKTISKRVIIVSYCLKETKMTQKKGKPPTNFLNCLELAFLFRFSHAVALGHVLVLVLHLVVESAFRWEGVVLRMSRFLENCMGDRPCCLCVWNELSACGDILPLCAVRAQPAAVQ